MRALLALAPLRWLRRHRWRRWEVGSLGVLGIVLLLLILAPLVLRRVIVARLSTITPATVRLADVDFNPFLGRLSLHDLSLTLPGEDAAVVTAIELGGDVRLFALLRGATVIEEVRLSGMRVSVVRQTTGALNLAKLLPPPPPDPSPETDLPTLTIERMQLSEVEIDYRDMARAPERPVRFSLYDLMTGRIDVQAKGLAAPTTVQLRGSVNLGGVAGEGQVFWSRSETMIDATLTMQRIALALVEPYVRGALSVRDLSGEADGRFHYRLQSGGDKPPAHALSGALTFADASFVEPSSGQTALQVEEGRIEITRIDLLNRNVDLASVALRHPQALVLQTPTGLNWALLASPSNGAAPSDEHGSGTNSAWRSIIQSVKVTGGEITYRDSTWPEAEAIKVAPEEIELQGFGDGTTESPVRFSVRVGDGLLTGAGGMQFSPLRMQMHAQLSKLALSSFQPLLVRSLEVRNAEGTVSGDVQAGLTITDGRPVATLAGALDASAIAIDGLPAPGNALAWTEARIELREGSSLTPLRLDTIAQLANVTIRNLPQGDVSLENLAGVLQLVGRTEAVEAASPQTENALSGATPLTIGAQGTLEVKSFLLAQGPEKQELVSCYGIKASLKEGSRLLPLDLRLTDVALEYPYAQGFRPATGRFQLAKPVALTPEAPTAPAGVDAPIVAQGAIPLAAQIQPADIASPSAAPIIHVDRVNFIGGQLYFEDHAISPPQTIYWQDIRVDLSDVGYPLSRPAAFALHAFNMDGAPIEVKGATDRQGDQLVTKVRGKIDRLTLSRFNVYLAPHLGYQVRKGAVSVKWELMMPGDLLRANAAVTLHDFRLGGKESASELETQVGLPMSLVIALLKDLNGNINLQLPVEGRLNEPGFRLGGTVWRAIRDVLIGAITSPLKLLGAVFSSEDTLEDFFLEPIPFIPGTNQLSPAGKEQLHRLGAFLAQRPELDVQLSSQPGAEDRQALQDRLVLAQLEAAMQTAPAPETPGATQETGEQKTTPEEEVRQFLLRQGKTPEEGKGLALSGSASALLAKLRETTTVAPQELEQLTQTRIQEVVATLSAAPKVAANRLRLSPEKLRGRGGAEVQYMIQARERK